MKELITYRIAIVAMAIALIFSCSQKKTEEPAPVADSLETTDPELWEAMNNL